MTGQILIAMAVFIAGLAIGLYIKGRRKSDGYLVINKHDPDKDYYKLELLVPFGELENLKTVTFKVIEE